MATFLNCTQKASEDAQDLKLNFTVKEDLFDEHWIVELQPGGADIPVTNENKLQYVNSVVNHKLNRQVSLTFDFCINDPFLGFRSWM